MSAQKSRPVQAIRISFARSEKDLSVVGGTLVQKRAPAGDPDKGAGRGEVHGLWLELRHGDAVVYSRHVTAQLDPAPEIFTGVPGEPILRSPSGERLIIDILVPLPTDVDAKELRLVVVEHRGCETRPLVERRLPDILREKPSDPRTPHKDEPGSKGTFDGEQQS